MIMADHEVVSIPRMEPLENSDTKAIKLKMLAIKLKKDLASVKEEVGRLIVYPLIIALIVFLSFSLSLFSPA